MWMSIIFLNGIFLFLIEKSFQLYRSSCRKDALFKLDVRGSRLDSDAISSGRLQKLSLCAKECLNKDACKTFNYHRLTKICELLSKNKTEGGSQLISTSGWNHYQPVAQKGTPRCISKDGKELCELHEKCVEVCENPKGYKCIQLENVALRKSTNQASTCWSGWSSRAVDGCAWVSYINRCCSHTCRYGTWWSADFGNTALVHSVVLTNRGDGLGGTLYNFNVRIGNSTQGNGDENAPCVLNGHVDAAATKSFPCRPRLYGRYMYVKAVSDEYLVICEIKAWGEFVRERT